MNYENESPFRPVKKINGLTKKVLHSVIDSGDYTEDGSKELHAAVKSADNAMDALEACVAIDSEWAQCNVLDAWLDSIARLAGKK